MLISVLIPTYRRPQDLLRCLEALKQQLRSADEIIIVVRDTDTQTWDFLKTFPANTLPLNIVTVTVPGVVAALNVGLGMIKGDILCITDDDAAPCSDWLARIEQHFMQDEQLGGVGGPDRIHPNVPLLEGTNKVVGQLQWFGRIIGNHHLGTGVPREVDVLKGVNMSYRRTAIEGLQFDDRMRGTGAQVHFEIAFSLRLKRMGWKLLYDPAVIVNHFPSQRFDEDQRGQFDRIAQINRVHNETLTLLEHLYPIQRIVFLIWGILLGTRKHRGFLQSLRFLPDEGWVSFQKWFASIEGRWLGWQTWRQSKRKIQKIHP
ncbi:MAG: glycosyltransferase [Elainellaceae cyanobacterium]